MRAQAANPPDLKTLPIALGHIAEHDNSAAIQAPHRTLDGILENSRGLTDRIRLPDGGKSGERRLLAHRPGGLHIPVAHGGQHTSPIIGSQRA